MQCILGESMRKPPSCFVIPQSDTLMCLLWAFGRSLGLKVHRSAQVCPNRQHRCVAATHGSPSHAGNDPMGSK